MMDRMMSRDNILKQLWDAQDEAYELMAEYDSIPHRYGQTTLYQSEAYIVNRIGRMPGVTITELAELLKKTPSACSQIVRKLIGKGLVHQERNEQNKRIYNLRLTPDGERMYEDHIAFNEACQKTTFGMLAEFTDAELETCLRVQRRINEAYQGDIQRSNEYYGNED